MTLIPVLLLAIALTLGALRLTAVAAQRTLEDVKRKKAAATLGESLC